MQNIGRNIRNKLGTIILYYFFNFKVNEVTQPLKLARRTQSETTPVSYYKTHRKRNWRREHRLDSKGSRSGP